MRHNNELFVFLDNPELEPTKNCAERELRVNVIMRKIALGKRSPHGAKKHEIIMSIVERSRSHGVEPLKLFLSLTSVDTSFH